MGINKRDCSSFIFIHLFKKSFPINLYLSYVFIQFYEFIFNLSPHCQIFSICSSKLRLNLRNFSLLDWNLNKAQFNIEDWSLWLLLLFANFKYELLDSQDDPRIKKLYENKLNHFCHSIGSSQIKNIIILVNWEWMPMIHFWKH